MLTEKVEAVVDMRDVGFLVGEFETPLLQEMCHERLYFVTELLLRRARDNEVIRIADQMDLVPVPLSARGAEALVHQSSLMPLKKPAGRMRTYWHIAASQA